jgi:hypothetical protein
MHKKLIGLTLAMALASAGTAIAWSQSQQASDRAQRVSDQAKQAYDQAKQAIYQKDWEKALAALEKIEKNYSQSAYMGETYYWLGYSMNKMAADMADWARQIEAKKDAIEKLNTLVEKFASSDWATDARILRVQIAESLAKSGLDEYRKYINGPIGAAGQHPSAEGEARLTPDEEIKLVALHALMGMDKEKAFPVLEQMVRTEKSEELRAQAVFVLSQSKDAKVVPLLADLAVKDPSSKVREMAVFWLGQSKDEAALDALLKNYASAGAEVKTRLIMAFGQNESSKAKAKLIEIAKSGEEAKIREQAIFWLGRSRGNDIAPALVEIYKKSTDSETKQAVIHALSQRGLNKAVPTLIELARAEKDPEAKKQIIFWLGRSKSFEALKSLRELLGK